MRTGRSSACRLSRVCLRPGGDSDRAVSLRSRSQVRDARNRQVRRAIEAWRCHDRHGRPCPSVCDPPPLSHPPAANPDGLLCPFSFSAVPRITSNHVSAPTGMTRYLYGAMPFRETRHGSVRDSAALTASTWAARISPIAVLPSRMVPSRAH